MYLPKKLRLETEHGEDNEGKEKLANTLCLA